MFSSYMQPSCGFAIVESTYRVRNWGTRKRTPRPHPCCYFSVLLICLCLSILQCTFRARPLLWVALGARDPAHNLH